MKEDYEVIPHQLLIELKGEVEALKKKLTRPDQKANERFNRDLSQNFGRH